MKKIVCFFVVILIFITVFTNSFAMIDINTPINDTATKLLQTNKNVTVSSIGGDWMILGLSRSENDTYKDFYDEYYENVKKYVTECNGNFSDKKYTEYSRVILALTSIGINPQNVEGFNLIMPLSDYEKTVWQGVNGAIFALLALDCGKYEIPFNNSANVCATRQMYVDKILNSQCSDGGWSLTAGISSDVDITAMALTALANYKGNTNVDSAINNAINYLSLAQNENGGFKSFNGENCESVAQVIVALCSLKININDTKFIKNEKTVLDSLMSFYSKNGGFYHTHNDDIENQMATEQGFYALVALKRFNENKTSLYDMSDVELKPVKTDDTNNYGLNEKNADIVKKEVVCNKTFMDISDCFAKKEIEELASRQIISGKDEKIFEPYSTMTRAEFAAIVTKSLGLTLKCNINFDDVSTNDWYFDFVSTAYNYGIVSGVSDNLFNPQGVITKEEAALMISRAANLCGIIKNYDNDKVRDILSEFTDYTKSSEWAQNALAFLYDNNILSSDEIEINPQKNVTRAEIAVMIYNMLFKAKLL